MPGPTLVLVDAGMVAGFRRSSPSLAQLHQAVLHLHAQHPGTLVAVLADPSLKWDLEGGEQALFDADIVASAVVCAPAGAVDGTHGFIERAAARASLAHDEVVAVTDRAVAGVTLGRVRNEGGRWQWDLTGGRTVGDDEAGDRPPPGRRRRRTS